MKISVIIPVYNVERYLARCLDSVIAASKKLLIRDAKYSVEIICINDGSTDSSAKVLAEYASKVKIIEKENGGQGSARNAGLDAATGDYVMFVDSDDFIPSDAILKFALAAESSRVAVVVSASFARDRLGNVRERLPVGSWTLRPFYWIAGKKVQYSVCNKLYRSDFVRNRRFGLRVFEDFPWITSLFCDVDVIAVIDESLYVYCRNVGAASTTRSPITSTKVIDSISAIRMVLDYVARDKDLKIVKFAWRQAVDGLSSTIGQVYKAGNVELERLLVEELRRFFAEYPRMLSLLGLKARYRLWKVGRLCSNA